MRERSTRDVAAAVHIEDGFWSRSTRHDPFALRLPRSRRCGPDAKGTQRGIQRWSAEKSTGTPDQ